jgi:hypothetical protein
MTPPAGPAATFTFKPLLNVFTVITQAGHPAGMTGARGRHPPPRATAGRRFGGLPRLFWMLWAGILVNRLGTLVEPFLGVYLVRALVRTLSPGAIWKADPRQPVRAGNPVRVMRPARIRG